MRARGTALIALVLLAAATTAAHAIASVTVFGLKAPEEVGGFRLNNSMNFERSKPGEGYSLDYSQPGWKLDVFIYDLKRSAIPDDAKSAIVRAEFERSREDVFLAQPRGLYAQVYLRRNFTIEDSAKRTRFQCAAFHMTRDGAKPQDGFLCVTSWNNKFIKFRMTTLSDRDTEATARSTWRHGSRCCGIRMPSRWRSRESPKRARNSAAVRRRGCAVRRPVRRAISAADGSLVRRAYFFRAALRRVFLTPRFVLRLAEATVRRLVLRLVVFRFAGLPQRGVSPV